MASGGGAGWRGRTAPSTAHLVCNLPILVSCRGGAGAGHGRGRNYQKLSSAASLHGVTSASGHRHRHHLKLNCTSFHPAEEESGEWSVVRARLLCCGLCRSCDVSGAGTPAPVHTNIDNNAASEAGLGWAGRGGPTFSCATFSVLGVDRGWARRGFTIKSFVLVFRRGWQAPGRHCATVTRHFFCWSNCQERGRAAPAYKVASSWSGGQPGFQCSGGVATNPEEILAHLFCMKKRHIKWCVAT